MEILLQQTFNLLTSSPGNLIYHLVLAFSVMAAIQAMFGAPRSSGGLRRRMLFGLSMILAGQLLLFLLSGLAWQGIVSARALLPPLDRAAILWSLLWSVWLWAFPDPERRADILVGIFSLTIAILFLFSYSLWIGFEAAVSFNETWLNLGWIALAVFIILAAILFLLLRKSPGWGSGLAFLSIHLVGFAAYLMLTNPVGFFVPQVRLAQLCAFPLLLGLAQRLSLASSESDKPLHQGQPAGSPAADLELLSAWLQLSEHDKPEKIIRSLPRALAQTLLSDICYLVSPPTKEAEIIVYGGYDRIHQAEMPGFILKPEEIPALSEAVRRGQALCLTQERARPIDLNAIIATTGLEQTGDLLFVPLISDRKPLGGVLLLSPYSKLPWSVADQAALQPLLDGVVQLIRQGEQKVLHKKETRALQKELEHYRQRNQNLEEENRRLSREVEKLRQAKPAARSDALATAHSNAQEIVASLQQLHQPLISIQGYADLLSSESLGTLGSPQHKMLERISATTERARGLLENLLFSLQDAEDAFAICEIAGETENDH